MNYDILFTSKMERCALMPVDKAHFQNTSTPKAISDEIAAISVPSEPEQDFIKWFNSYIKDSDISTFAEKEFLKYLPKFLYFSEYQKMPERSAIDDYIEKSKWNTF